MVAHAVENRLIMAEKISVMAKRMSNGNYPIARYTYAWKNVLFNQFHDIMAGTSAEPAYEDAPLLILTAQRRICSSISSGQVQYS